MELGNPRSLFEVAKVRLRDLPFYLAYFLLSNHVLELNGENQGPDPLLVTSLPNQTGPLDLLDKKISSHLKVWEQTVTDTRTVTLDVPSLTVVSSGVSSLDTTTPDTWVELERTGGQRTGHRSKGTPHSSPNNTPPKP